MKKPKIRERPGLLEYLKQRMGLYSGNGPEYHFHCPFCIDTLGDESAGKQCRFNLAEIKFHCFRCKFGTSNLEKFFRKLNGGSLRLVEWGFIRGEIRPPAKDFKATIQAMFHNVKEVAELKPVPLPTEMATITREQWGDPPIRFKRGVRYMQQRGLSFSAAQRYSIGYCPTGRYAQRLVFPVYQGGEQVYFITRYAGKHTRKSLNPTQVEGHHRSGTCLFNYDNVVGEKVVSICEGPFDVLAHKHAVGLTGKELSAPQVKLLKSLADHGTEEFVISLDAGASRDAHAIYRGLTGRLPKVSMLVLKYGDPDERRAELSDLMRTRAVPNLTDGIRNMFNKD